MNRPPKPRTTSQEIAAQLPTMPAPRNPETGAVDGRAEPPSDPSLEQIIDVISKSEAPREERDRAIVTIARELKRVSGHDGSQDLAIAALRADVMAQGERLDSLSRSTLAQSETLGGRAAEVAKAEPPPESPAAATAPPPEPAPAKSPPTVVSRLEEISRASGSTRLVLIVVLVLEGLRWAAPFLEPILHGGHGK